MNYDETLTAVAKAAELHRETLVEVLKVTMEQMNDYGMAFQDESWWSAFCELQKQLPRAKDANE